MISDALRSLIAEAVKLSAERVGLAKVRPGPIAARFRDRGDYDKILDFVRREISHLRSGGELRNTNCLALVDPFTMVTCIPLNMTLTAKGCAKLWEGARDVPPKIFEGRAACVGCAVGAERAGYSVPETAKAVENLRRICPRCLVSSSRLINGRHCVSCYNRHCEALRGRNARGTRPRLCERLRTERLAVSDRTGSKIVILDGVIGPVEAILVRAKECSSVTYFGWANAGTFEMSEAA